MKHNTRITLYVTLICGLAGSLLLRWFLSLRDAAGLLPALHPAKVLVCLLSVLYVVFLLIAVRKAPAGGTLSPSPVSTVCMILSGILLVLYGISSAVSSRSGLQILVLAASILAAVCLILMAVCRLKGKTPAFWATLVLPVYAIFFTVLSTRYWGRDTQVITYLFCILGALAVMLAAYHHAAFYLGKSSPRSLMTWSQLALYFCMLSLNSTHWMYYLSMGLLMAANCVSLQETPEEKV